MSTKEIIGKMTPAHFENGENFDKEAFASLIDALPKWRSNLWKMPVFMFLGFLISLVFSKMGGFIGNILAIVCIFAGIIGANLSVKGYVNQAKAAMKKLGITQKEINIVMEQIKKESQ